MFNHLFYFKIHFHVFKSYVVFLKDANGEYTGQLRLANIHDFLAPDAVINEQLMLEDDEALIEALEQEFRVVLRKRYTLDKEVLYLTKGLINRYIPTDWRAEVYLQGLQKRANGQRPDIFEQELLDKFDSIYNFKEQSYKVDIVARPNS